MHRKKKKFKKEGEGGMMQKKKGYLIKEEWVMFDSPGLLAYYFF